MSVESSPRFMTFAAILTPTLILPSEDLGAWFPTKRLAKTIRTPSRHQYDLNGVAMIVEAGRDQRISNNEQPIPGIRSMDSGTNRQTKIDVFYIIPGRT